MKKRYSTYLKLNIMSLFFLLVSFLSITLAWFAYSGIARAQTDIKVKSWYIEFQKDNNKVSNDIVLSLEDIYPGMNTITEKISIKNLGDSDAQVNYSISSARIFNTEIDVATLKKEVVEDKLAHDYPFHINVALNKGYVRANHSEEDSELNVSISWPLDSDDDLADSNWGTEAFNFQKQEEAKLKANPNYQIKSSIKIVISLKAEQYLTDNNAIDMNYNLGDTILYDIVNNKLCKKVSDNCKKTYIIDVDNKIGNPNVLLLPDLFDRYASGSYYEYESMMNNGWNVSTKNLEIKDLLKIISKDITNSYLTRNNFSNEIIGNMNYPERLDMEVDNLKVKNGSYEFLSNKFLYLSTSKCYWFKDEYNSDYAYALVNKDSNHSKIYKEAKSSNCSVVPLITAPKANLYS